MKPMKKLLGLLLAVCMLLSMAACGNSSAQTTLPATENSEFK